MPARSPGDLLDIFFAMIVGRAFSENGTAYRIISLTVASGSPDYPPLLSDTLLPPVIKLTKPDTNPPMVEPFDTLPHHCFKPFR